MSVCGEWFDDLDFQNWYPNPSAETRGDNGLLYEFDPPTGDTLEVHLDARTAPGQFGEIEECRIEVLEQDLPVVGVDITDWRMP